MPEDVGIVQLMNYMENGLPKKLIWKQLSPPVRIS
jgi:hypothetical protein